MRSFLCPLRPVVGWQGATYLSLSVVCCRLCNRCGRRFDRRGAAFRPRLFGAASFATAHSIGLNWFKFFLAFLRALHAAASPSLSRLLLWRLLSIWQPTYASCLAKRAMIPNEKKLYRNCCCWRLCATPDESCRISFVCPSDWGRTGSLLGRGTVSGNSSLFLGKPCRFALEPFASYPSCFLTV